MNGHYAPAGRAHIIVLGNEKGGSGKSTTAMHVIVALLKRGYRVGSIDLDARQGTLSRQIENRRYFARNARRNLALPEHRRLRRSEAPLRSVAEAEERAPLDLAKGELADRDYIAVDTPGSDNLLSRLGHGHADTLITPLSDSFLDLDLLARLDAEGRTMRATNARSDAPWNCSARASISGWCRDSGNGWYFATSSPGGSRSWTCATRRRRRG